MRHVKQSMMENGLESFNWENAGFMGRTFKVHLCELLTITVYYPKYENSIVYALYVSLLSMNIIQSLM